MISDSIGCGDILPAMSSTDAAERLHSVLRTCDARLRLEILVQLIVGPLDVTMLCAALSLEKSPISKSLGELRKLGILACQKKRTHHIFSITSAVNVEYGPERVLVTIFVDDHLGFALVLPRSVIERVRAERGITESVSSPTHMPTPSDALAPVKVSRTTVANGQRFSVIVRPTTQPDESHIPKRPAR